MTDDYYLSKIVPMDLEGIGASEKTHRTKSRRSHRATGSRSRTPVTAN